MSRAFRYHKHHDPRIFEDCELKGLEALGWKDSPGAADEVKEFPEVTDPDEAPSPMYDPTEETPEPTEEPSGEDGEDSATDGEPADASGDGSEPEPETAAETPPVEEAPRKKGWPKGKKRK